MHCHIDNHDHINNGMMTKIWGQPGWIFNHTVTFGYPIEPDEEKREQYRRYFLSLGDVLPCRYCRESYQQFVTTGDTALTDEALTNRETLTHWFFRIHEAVNKKLGIDYGITYEDLVDKYESFRAMCGKSDTKGCTVPLDYKAFSFKKLYDTDAPIIPLDIARQFIPLAKSYGLDKHLSFLDLASILNDDYRLLKQQPCWKDRNKYCSILIKNMRINSILSTDVDGVPTCEETALIMYSSSNLNLENLMLALEKSKKIS